MKKSLICAALWLTAAGLSGQTDRSAYHFLRIPTSAHAAALGGPNISLVDDDAELAAGNPALLSNVSDRTLSLDYTRYVAASNLVGARFVKAFGERHTGSVGMHYLGYGSQTETDEQGTALGTFTPKDMVADVGYGYLLSDRWSGGAQARLVYSHYAGYSSAALAVTVGVNYYNDERDFSASAVLRDVGVQLKRFDERSYRLPYDLQVGITKGFDHAPVRFSLTLTDLTHWSAAYYYSESGMSPKPLQRVLNHCVVGVDFLPARFMYLSLGYNFRRAYELKAAGKAHAAGLTCGGGLRVKRFRLDAAYARYHAAASSFTVGVAYAL